VAEATFARSEIDREQNFKLRPLANPADAADVRFGWPVQPVDATLQLRGKRWSVRRWIKDLVEVSPRQTRRSYGIAGREGDSLSNQYRTSPRLANIVITSSGTPWLRLIFARSKITDHHKNGGFETETVCEWARKRTRFSAASSGWASLSIWQVDYLVNICNGVRNGSAAGGLDVQSYSFPRDVKAPTKAPSSIGSFVSNVRTMWGFPATIRVRLGRRL
jgi:hypothetical protein